MELTSSQTQALKLLTSTAEGSTVPALVRNGCTVEELRHLGRSRLIITERVSGSVTRRAPTAVRVRISDAGRKALALQEGRTNRRKILTRSAILVLFALGVLAGAGVGALMATH